MDKNSMPTEREAETISSKASKAEFAKDYDQAFRLYIKAAECFLHLSRSSAASDKNKQQWKSSASRALERAEKIKNFVEVNRSNARIRDASNQTRTPDVHLTPVGINHFSPQEQFFVLKKGDTVNGLRFPLWNDAIPVKNPPIEAYSDPEGQPSLSLEQEKASPVWRRPSSNAIDFPTPHPNEKILPQQILQHVVTDCSVCASISVCLEHGRRFDSGLDLSIHRAFEEKVSTSKVACGRYDVRVLFNGAWRRVVIDDRLPYHPTEGRLMCMSVVPRSSKSSTSRIEPEILWPSFIEKAYMKLMGGYDFPGSNSSIDLRTLTGWIPEHVDLKGSTFEREKTWERIKQGFSSGQCVVTLGTGPASNVRWRNTPLLPSHSYAVIDVYESEEGRIVTVLDSWVRPDEMHEQSRELHMPWSEVLNTFSGAYLSWDPKKWPKALTFHSMWKRNTEDDDTVRHAQIAFSCDSDSDEEIWVLLTRHVFDTRRTSDFASLWVEVEDDVILGTTTVESQRTLSKRTYTNSTHILVRTRVPASQRSGILGISASYDGDAREVGFTLTAYAKANTKMSWIEKTSTPPYTSLIEGAFTSKTGGGNCTYPTFMVNPQYQLTVQPSTSRAVNGMSSGTTKAKITLNLQINKDIPVNIAMVWSQGSRVSELSTKDLVATSGAYNYGLARVTKTITPGSYVIVASAFEPHHAGGFSLKVDSSCPFDLRPIPQEGAGLYCKVARGSWEGLTAAGAPSFEKYSNNPIFELEIPSTSQLKIRLQVLQPSSSIALNTTVYANINDDVTASINRKAHITTSGAYDDAIAGVATPQVTVGAGKYYVVPSTYNPGTESGFRILVYSSVSGIKVTSNDRP